MPRAKAVIYDLDGTVADTQRIHEDIELRLLAEHGIYMSPRELSIRFAGVSLQETFRAIFLQHRIEKSKWPDFNHVSERKKLMLHARWPEFRLMPGILEQTRMLRAHGIKLAIASASRLETIELILTTLGIRDRFDSIASTKEVENGKPSPDVFLLAACRINTHAQDCLVIGDGVADILGARTAGMRSIALWKHPPRYLPAELVVSDLRDIPKWIF